MSDSPGELSMWIDLHTHILPGIDDGAQDIQQALDMVRAAQEDGIGYLVATPHNQAWPARDHRPLVEQATHELNDAIQEAGLRPRVLPGVEVYVTPDIRRQIEMGQAFALAGSRYVLLELPISAYPLYVDQTIFELQVMGFAVILAHPERNVRVEAKPETLAPLVERGVLIQLTAGSLVGQFGAHVQRTALYLLRHRMAHVIASDAHNARHRPPVLSAAVAVAGEIVGSAQAHAMVSTIPRAILDNHVLEFELPEREQMEKRGFWASLWRR